MKYRRNKVKREHGIIQDALGWLEELSQNPEVTDIIPGVIQVSRSPERGIVYKYETQTGCKILLKSNGSIQEAFVVTQNPEFVQGWVKNHFPASDKTTEEVSNPIKNIKKQRPENQNSQKLNSPPRKPQNRKFKGKKKALNTLSKHDRRLESKYLNLDINSPNVGQRINSQTRQALREFQKELNSAKGRKNELG